MKKLSYFSVFKTLIQADLTIFKHVIVDKFIDIGIWVILNMLVIGYIMPFFGLSHNFGIFQLGSILAATGLFELYGNTIDLVSDFEGDRIINYNLTIPLPSWLTIFAKGTYYFIIYFILSILIVPIGKICLWNEFILSDIIYFKFIVALIVQNIFYACFIVWASSVIQNITNLGKVWSRFVFPMWFMGGFHFSWKALYHTLPTLALVNLLNPMIYITESMRVALLGQADYINFWICIGTIMLFSALCLTLGMRNLKKRLDFV